MRHTVITLVTLAGLTATLATAMGTHGASRFTSARSSDPATVYKVVIEASENQGKGRYGWTQWVDTRTGAFRMLDGPNIRIYDGRRTHAAIDSKNEIVEIRRGSQRFLGYLARGPLDLSGALLRLKQRSSARNFGSSPQAIEFQSHHGTVQATLRLVDTLTASQAKARNLFSIPTRWSNLSVERPVGAAPTNGVHAYWLGSSSAGRVAVTAKDFTSKITLEQRLAGMERKEQRLHLVFYERPEAGYRSSALPGQDPPSGEIQVVTQPLTLPSAQGAIDAFNGVNGELTYKPWPRFRVVLRNGETATVVPHRGDRIDPTADGEERFTAFSVITNDSLISVGAVLTEAQIRSIARNLQPVTT